MPWPIIFIPRRGLQSFHNRSGHRKMGKSWKELIGISNRSTATTIDNNAIHKIYPRLTFNSHRSTVIRPTTMKKSPAILALVALCFASQAFARKGFGPGEQEWGYVKVRPASYMFWWLYYTTNANVSSYYDKPLIIWLQGGPGASSTSYGNFEELGPLDADLRPRNFSWVKDYNILFIDNPIGTGFSYATLSSGFAKTNAEIARDLVECMKGFLKALPGFQDVPTYITTESYGGKMGAEFALQWYKAQKSKIIKSNLKGVALGDAWISPIDSVLTWAPFLLATGMVDTEGYKKIDDVAQKTKNAVETNSWKTATMLWMNAEAVVAEVTDNIDFYNILTRMEASGTRSLAERIRSKPFLREYATFNDASLTRLMNGPVKEALQLSIVHGAQSNMVFTKLQEDFMKPVINIVEELLSETDLKVAVITGHMDLIVDTPGTLNWVEKMNWKNANLWHYSPRYPIVVQEIIEGYEKSYDNFAMYWVNRAGHMVPKDNPAAMGRILQKFTGQ